VKKHRLLDDSKEAGIEVNVEETKYTVKPLSIVSEGTAENKLRTRENDSYGKAF
jgi:hypothetical protein